jgi:anti-anti-sigma factor
VPGAYLRPEQHLVSEEFRMQNDGPDLTPRPIEIDLKPDDAPTFAAAVRLCGEHDLATGPDIREALKPIHGDVLVDLSACEFIDSTVIGVLLADANARKAQGHRLELLVPADNRNIHRTLHVSGVAKLLAIRAIADPGESQKPA